MLLAVGLGLGFTFSMTLPLDNAATVEQAGSWTVFMLFCGYLIAALGPVCFGALRDYTGTYVASYAMLFAVLLFMLAITPLLKSANKVVLQTSPA